MYIISSRLDFTNSDRGNRNSHGVITTITKKVNLRTGEIDNTNISNISTLLNNKRVLVLIHGYNNNWDSIREAYNVLETNFHNILKGNNQNKYDEIVGFIWPGGDHAVEYLNAKNRVKNHFEPLANLIEALSSSSSIDIMTHSLGCYLTLSSLTFYNSAPNTTIINNLFLTAPAIDDESIEYKQKFYDATQLCEKVYVFHSRNDSTLKVWYRIGDFGNRALGVDGPENVASIIQHSKNVVVVNCKNVAKDHGYYKHNKQIFAYLQKELIGSHSAQFVTLI